MIKRRLGESITKRLFSGKAILLTGPRQTGKTTLLQNLFGKRADVTWLNGDDPETRMLLVDVNISKWKRIIGDKKILIIDEAQRIENIGVKLKLIVDQLRGIQVIASGSSAFELANRINEPLTGRKWQFHLFPISFGEMERHHGFLQENSQLTDRLIYGYYPEIVSHREEMQQRLGLLVDSFLYKDILMWEGINKPEKLTVLLQALAFQVGNEVSYHELGQIVDLDNQTVQKYIALLEQTFIVFRLGPLSRNLRKELKTKRKIYFYDNGVRNAIIAQFQPLELRQDIGALWENWLVSERKKFLHYHGVQANTFFWRTQDQQEIDYIEERNGEMWAFEFKWNPKSKHRFSKSFTRAYPMHQLKVINKDNYFDWLGEEE